MADTTHLTALHTRLMNEKARKAHPLQSVWVAQIEKEIAGEMEFLGITHEVLPVISDDDLLDELGL